MTYPAADLERVRAETFLAQVEHHAMVKSTNDLAKERGATPSGGLPLLIVADQQSAGRGRGTKRWWTGAGSLAFSLLLEPVGLDISAGRAALISLAAAVAVIDTARPLAAGVEIGLHWPNDVHAGGRKLAGILVETLTNRRQVVGIGMNVNNLTDDAPPELRDVVTTLRALTGRRHDPTAILVGVLHRLEVLIGQLAAAPERITQRADSLCMQHGQTLSFRIGKQSVTGCCAGIAPDGALLLETSQGRRAVYSGTPQE